MKNPEASAVKREAEDSGKWPALIRSRVNAGAKIGRPKERAAKSRKLDKGWCRHKRGLNDSESTLSTNCDFSRTTGAGGRQRQAVKREAEEDWGKEKWR
jgi:hypothetical protein